MKQPKTYFFFINDHSGSMGSISSAAMMDYNTNINAIKDSTSRELLDTIVSVIAVGYPYGSQTERQIVNSNPHVLKPMDRWPTPGGTPLYDGIADAMALAQSLPDFHEPHVSFLFLTTTDGAECSSVKENIRTIQTKLAQFQKDSRFTFVFRIPRGQTHLITQLGIPPGNVQEWDTTAAGMAQATAQTTAAIDNYVTTRASGKTSSNTFFADVSNVNLAALEPMAPKKYSLYVSGQVPGDTDGMMISDFILARRMQYLKGAAFYQLVKTENKVQPNKNVLIRERTTGKVFAGKDARKMIGLPDHQNARLNPGDHENFDIFIQSSSWNRKIPHGTGVIYVESLGQPFTQEEVDLFTKPAGPKRVSAQPVPVQLPAVHNVGGGTVKSTMPVNKRRVFFASREDARNNQRLYGKKFTDHGKGAPKGERYEQL